MFARSRPSGLYVLSTAPAIVSDAASWGGPASSFAREITSSRGQTETSRANRSSPLTTMRTEGLFGSDDSRLRRYTRKAFYVAFEFSCVAE
jgi:hypothetical protein